MFGKLSLISFVIAIFIAKSEVSGLRIFFICDDEMWKGARTYTCTSASIADVLNPTPTYDAYHIFGRVWADVRYIRIVGIQNAPSLLGMPQNITTRFPGVTMFHIEYQTSLRALTSNDLAQFPNLEVFESSWNGITSLPSDLFKNNPRLKEVEFWGSVQLPTEFNSLYQIGENLLGGLPDLSKASFLRHKCINEGALNRTEVVALNTRLHVLCPVTETSSSPTTSTTSSQSSVHQKLVTLFVLTAATLKFGS